MAVTAARSTAASASPLPKSRRPRGSNGRQHFSSHASPARGARHLRVSEHRWRALGAGKVRGELRAGHAEPGQARRPLPNDARRAARKHRLPRRLPGGERRRPPARRRARPRSHLRGGHRLPARAPRLRARHRGLGAHARLLDGGAQAGGGEPPDGRARPRRGCPLPHRRP